MEFSDQATMWDRRGRPIELPDSADASEAMAINNAGEIAGWQSEQGGQRHACAWKGGSQRLLPELPESRSSEAVAINNTGWIAGTSGTAVVDKHGNPQSQAVLWRDGKVIDLGTLGGAWSRANAVNNAGQIVGESSTGADKDGDGDDDTSAFVWNDGEMSRLPAPPQHSETMATDINDRGEIVGGALVDARGRIGIAAPPLEWWRFTFWSEGKVEVGRWSVGHPALNSAGTVVDWFHGDVENIFLGLFYANDRSFALRNRIIPDPERRDWQSDAPRDINRHRQIAGWKMSRYYDTKSVRAVRLDPLPPSRPKRWSGR